ncbi:SAM-dependent methyltransferase [Brumimicrobium aurantiacum]|uniref:SAM-dependent methyltransferase n=1 Tax=Brumimicrobium aurantiacum TaxID=1737063 RepID=A0A3E1F192_9FLAO|nr:SAM-dependent methyltransferase [Brumimicrobium aurantiacum]RFC55497.1 SAM-dependent methyltransferase [Brumimicrobium aurantiacum]
MSKGKLYLMPTLMGSEKWEHVIPAEVAEIAKNTRYFAVENLKSARRYLRKIDRTFPIDESTFFILNKKTPPTDLAGMLSPLKKGENVAIISEAGCPGVADPGADLVALAHQKGDFVSPLTGPSSILLALMASGFNGQSFTFNGYIPKERKKRVFTFKDYERLVSKTGQTQIFMETPFRNNHLLEDLLNECLDTTFLCVACDLTLPTERVQTMTVAEWRENAFDLNKRPTMFLIGKPFAL